MADAYQKNHGMGELLDFMKSEDENELYNLLIAVSKEMQIDHAIEDITLEEAAFDIKQQQDEGWKNNVYTDIDYNDIIKCCAYLSFYAPCHAALVRHGIRWFYEQMPVEIYNGIFGRESLNMVCAGGGPGNDFLGFCCTMESLPRLFRKLNLTVIDLKGSWENIMAKVMSKAQTHGAGKVQCFLRNVQFSYNFVTADLRHDSVDALERADLILMAKVLSNVSYKERLIMIENIVSSMKMDAIVVCIDVPLGEVEEFVTRHLNDVKVLVSKGYDEFRHNVSSPVKNRFNAIRFSHYKICVLQKSIPQIRERSCVRRLDYRYKAGREFSNKDGET